MALATDIIRRSGSQNYYVRISVPKDLRARYGKSEVWKSLKTTDPDEAKRRSRPILDAYDGEFAAMRAKRSLTDYELQNAIWSRYTELVQADRQRRVELLTEEDLDDIWQALVDDSEIRRISKLGVSSRSLPMNMMTKRLLGQNDSPF